MAASERSPLAALRDRLPALMPADEARLRRRLDGLRGVRDEAARSSVLDEITLTIEEAEERVAKRRAAVPKITYPPALPVSGRRDEILAAIRDHQVVIVAGETGSGKTTQIPKICLEAGRGIRGRIGHTQPRRIAARTVATRIAEELNTPLGEAVGWKVRFTDKVSDKTLVKLMTDGILLAEIQSDRMLRGYDTIIIDEAHERSLNIDFIMGYLKQLLPKRPDLKVIITSATIETERFAQHFGDAPVIEVSGRTFPVEVRYRPIFEDAEDRDEDPDQISAICDAVDELSLEKPGDILVFLSGEREIRDTADALNKRKLRNTEVLPLYARLSTAEQQRIFQPHGGRRIVLATNVAETSLTVPGIKYVIDPGTARISRYSHRTKVQRLPIEPISQASANQRKGRCGRTSDGICVRLYAEADFNSRAEYTDPEILRTNLASVILQMTAAGLGEIESFPFIDPPDRRNIKAGVELLVELGAIDPKAEDPRKRLTQMGRQLAALPVDPRLARMVIEADRNGAVREVMVIAAALSIQDPRERPADKQAQADQKHARFADPESDFMAYLNLWNWLGEQQEELSANQFRRTVKGDFLNFLRIREWQDIHSQLRQVLKGMGVRQNDVPADPANVHTALLSGLLSHIGLKDTDKREYTGARGARFAVFPGSSLFKKTPRWVMAAELVETSRLWGRIAAKIEPEQIEPLAQHLVKRTYSEPHWERKAEAVMAMERVTLYGVPIVAQRKVNFGRIDPETSRELFIRHALVEGDWNTHHRFFHDNRELLDDVEELEHRVRRRDILVDDETLFNFYEERVPAEVVSGRHFDTWWKRVRKEQPDLLSFEKSMLINEGAGGINRDDYPDWWESAAGIRLRLSYQFEPGDAADGVTVHIPLPVLNQVTPEEFTWQIRGLREELTTALVKSLPKSLRTNFVPAPDYARAALHTMGRTERSFYDELGLALRAITGVSVPQGNWDFTKIPPHLLMTFRIIDEKGKRLGESRDLSALRTELATQIRAEVNLAGDGLTREGIKTWDFGTLPRVHERTRGGYEVKAYPAIVDEGASVAIRLLDTPAEQQRAMWAGVRRLLLLNSPSPIKAVLGRLSNPAKLALAANPYAKMPDMFEDCVTAAVDHLMTRNGGAVWDRDSFTRLHDAVRQELVPTVETAVQSTRQVLGLWQRLDKRLKSTTNLSWLPSLTDMRQQLDGLIYPGFISQIGLHMLQHLPRYLEAIERRLDRIGANPGRDRDLTEQLEYAQEAYAKLIAELPASRRYSVDVKNIRWMIEELRVSFFAQNLGTAYPISEQRIAKAISSVRSAV
ncbi:ATP-dependent helicase [Actinorhabdospora filicis]|uniref:RNA helicase n=1 Tax=Actinorhabdospora filicis TaxID=1785913 RepID=A0A9W6SPI3_9ACTN|nr:ATP-dependent RNA helicase HrpA [Actinorhabdospora filicis]GLZ79753.1 ATP-dependent helicase [Actinorhabdospora filicis]